MQFLQGLNISPAAHACDAWRNRELYLALTGREYDSSNVNFT